MNLKYPILLMIFCTILTALGQYFLKKGVSYFQLSFISIFTNYYLLLGVFIYALATILFLLALSKGELSIIFPLVTLSYVWVALAAYFLLGETLGIFKVLGILSIGGGAFFLGRG